MTHINQFMLNSADLEQTVPERSALMSEKTWFRLGYAGSEWQMVRLLSNWNIQYHLYLSIMTHYF